MTTTIEEYLEKVQMLQRRAMGLADFNIMPDEPNKDIEPIRELVRIIETLEA